MIRKDTMRRDRKYSVYLTKDEADLLHEIYASRVVEGEKAAFSEIFAEALCSLHENIFSKNDFACEDLRVIESYPSLEEN